MVDRLDRARQKASRGEMLTFLALPKTSHLGRKLAVYPKAGWRSAKAGLRTRHPKTSHLGRKFTLCPKAGLRNPRKFTLCPKAGLRNLFEFTICL